MEGAYNKIAQRQSALPDPSYEYFTSMLMDTVRDEIASCAQSAPRPKAMAPMMMRPLTLVESGRGAFSVPDQASGIATRPAAADAATNPTNILGRRRCCSS